MADRATLVLGPELGLDGAPLGSSFALGSSELTTHGVIVGMTGSGKTGLAVVLLEEALAGGVPAVVLDPKGDLGSLALVFPEQTGPSFRPWIDEAQAQAAGLSPDAYAAQVAGEWQAGLAAAGIGAERLQALRDAADVTVYTPGSTAGVPLDLIGSLRAPPLSWETETEVLRDEIQSTVTSLLSLVGVDSDPLAGREHVLLATLVETAWRAGRDLDLASLIGEVQQPPLRKLGVFEIDQFFPPSDRTELAFRLNALVASPSFASWSGGAPLDPQRLLFAEDGRPRCAVISLAHLSDAERMVVATLVLSKLVTWMRTQPGTSDLRALVYMDEVFGFLPPTAEPPAKRPLLTIFKQGRAFGLGLVVATQNPVDLDYKAMANAGTWLVGRLQTENDKARVLEGLRSAAGGTDVAALDRALGALGKRQFLAVSARASAPRLLTTRWAMSYLRGPLTREHLARLAATWHATEVPLGAAAPTAAAPTDGGTPVAPVVADGIPVGHLDPAAPWAAAVGAVPGGTRLVAALALRCSLRYDEAKAGLDHLEEWEAIVPLADGVDLEAAIEVDYDERDLRPEPPVGARYELPPLPLDERPFFRETARSIEDRLIAARPLALRRNAALKLWSRPGETEPEFDARCAAAADARADAETAALADRLGARRERLESALRTAQLRHEEARADASARQQRDLVAGAGALLGSLFGGRSTTRGLTKIGSALTGNAAEARAATAAAKAQDVQDDLAALELELAAEIAEIQERWDETARAIDVVEVRLEDADVKVVDTRVVWVPRA